MTRMMNKLQSFVTVAITAACVTLAGCDDSPVAPDNTVPEAAAVPKQVVAATSVASAGRVRPDAASVALRDALERVLPTFESGSSSTALAAGLTQALASLESPVTTEMGLPGERLNMGRDKRGWPVAGQASSLGVSAPVENLREGRWIPKRATLPRSTPLPGTRDR